MSRTYDSSRSKLNTSVPTQNPFQPRPFSVQAQTETFAPQQENTEAEQTGISKNLTNIPIFAPGAIPPDPPKPGVLQAKLTIGQVGDRYEQEADRVASVVVNKINSPAFNPIQRQQITEQEEQSIGNIQRQEIADQGQTKFGSNGVNISIHAPGAPAPAPINIIQRQWHREPISTPQQSVEETIQRKRGSGEGLAENVRQPMEQALGADFSGVRVHTDNESNQLNQSLGARAFTTGQDVFFRQGAYEPGSRGGQELLAHELTHVVQQTGSLQRQVQKIQGVGQEIVQMMPKVKPSNLPLEEAEKALARANKELAFELAQSAVDIAGIADPTPISDGISAAMSIAKGDYVSAGLSIISMIPYLGDTVGKPIKAARNGKKIIKLRKEIAALINRIRELQPSKIKAAENTKAIVSQNIKNVFKQIDTKSTKKAVEPSSKKPWKQDTYHGSKPEYDNPGHHDPASPNFRGGGSQTTMLPRDAEEVYKHAIPDPKAGGKTWWGRNAQGEFYRYQQHSDGKIHWNGRENSTRGLQPPNYIIKRFKSLDKDLRR